MRSIALALLGILLAVAVAAYLQLVPPTPEALKRKLFPQPAPTVQKLRLSGVSGAPLVVSPAVRVARPATPAARELLAYYQDQQKEPAWREAVRRLAAAESGQ